MWRRGAGPVAGRGWVCVWRGCDGTRCWNACVSSGGGGSGRMPCAGHGSVPASAHRSCRAGAFVWRRRNRARAGLEDPRRGGGPALGWRTRAGVEDPRWGGGPALGWSTSAALENPRRGGAPARAVDASGSRCHRSGLRGCFRQTRVLMHPRGARTPARTHTEVCVRPAANSHRSCVYLSAQWTTPLLPVRPKPTNPSRLGGS
jgi:hypothetical protein